VKREKHARWAGLWASVVVLLVYFLAGLLGHYANLAIIHAPPG
jgi:hypothetical protein